ncbi:Dbl homology domain-containing protein [Zopfochytrium polystomum]|nr:Dbl homology domain-containing protein [Zopfochytrium polystomum]
MEDAIPSGLDPPLLRSPLYSADAMVLLAPHLIDSITGSFPAEAWDWQSTPLSSWTPGPSDDRKPKPSSHTVETNLLSDPNDGKRGHAVLEILTTERTYYQELGIIKNVCRQRLVEREILGKIAIQQIFAGMDDLYALHTSFLARLEETVSVDQWSPTHSSIGLIFLEFKEEMKKRYTTYINNHQSSSKTMGEEEAKNPEFRKFLHDLTKSSETKRTELKDFLVRPMQRMTKYPLLLKELAKRTPEFHPDATNIANAWDAMSDLAAFINEKMRTANMQTALFAAYESTLNCPPTFISAKRSCVMDIDAVDRRGNTHHLYLCSDLIMISVHVAEKTSLLNAFGSKRTDQPQQYRFIRWIDLQELVFEEMGNDWVRFTVSERRSPHSVSTPNHPSVVEFKIDGAAPGSQRREFVRALQSEMKSVQQAAVVRLNNEAAAAAQPSN